MKTFIRSLFCLFLFGFIHVDAAIISFSAEQKDIVFQDIPLVIEEKWEGRSALTLLVYDPADTVLAPRLTPFMKMTISFNENGSIKEADLSELARTDSLTGAQLLELVKYLQVEYAIPAIEVIDLAWTLPCSMNGTFCDYEPVHHLSTLLTYLTGKGFYERGGAIPLRETGRDQVRSAATRFLHQTLRIDQLVHDLHLLANDIPKASRLTDSIQNAVVLTQSDETDRISELFIHMRAQSNLDRESHSTWHKLLNQFVGMEDHCLLELSDYILTSQEIYPELINCFCAHFILDFIDDQLHLVDGFTADEPLEGKKAKREYYFDHQVEIFESFLAMSWDDEIDDSDEDEYKSPLINTYRYRLGMDFLMKSVMRTHCPIPNLREIYYRAKAFKDEFKSGVNAFYNTDSNEWSELAEWIEEVSAENDRIGYTILKWYAAREIVQEFNLFEFIHD